MNRETPNLDFSFVLASSVHDMKNSLGMLLTTLADVMEQYPPQNTDQAKSYAVLEYEAARINSELIQLLSIYRLEHDQIRVYIEEYSVHDLISEQVARNHELLLSRNILLTVECDENLFGYFDSDLVGGVINNVVVNSIRYSKQALHIAAALTEEGLCITIEDDGPGYPEDMINASTYATARRDFDGGRPHLGLLFANKVALLHQCNNRQGFIRLSNAGSLGGGRFQLFLP